MLAKTRSGVVHGVAASLVEIEVSIAPGGNGDFRIVGLPDTAIRESRARIQAALRNSGFEVPYRQITVNLAPASLPKEGVAFDLPMAVGILAARGLVQADLSVFMMAGELSLDGEVRSIRGGLSIALLAREHGVSSVVVPIDNASEAALAEGTTVYGVRTLAEVVEFVAGIRRMEPVRRRTPTPSSAAVPVEDFADVRGQPHAKHAIEVAVAGGHNILMMGPPGSGKTMLARRIPSIMPPMTIEESLEATQIHSTRGLVPPDTGLVSVRPFRAPHHTVSSAGLVGGGSIPRPGEISLAHNGILFLDELPEFSRSVLEALRQPLEEGRITLTRSQHTLSFPASLMLVAAMNPCPCGFNGDSRRECVCTPKQIHAYRSRISGPLLDRIDIQVEVPAVTFKEVSENAPAESSAGIQERVVAARRVQLGRFAGSGIRSNAGMRPAHLRRWCELDSDSRRLLEKTITQLGLSARGWSRVLKVARTVADLEAEEEIRAPHLAEALRYRRLDAR